MTIVSKPSTRAYCENYDRIFKKDPEDIILSKVAKILSDLLKCDKVRKRRKADEGI